MGSENRTPTSDLAASAQRLATETLTATDASGNEANLRHEIEILLRRECRQLDIPYAPYHLEHVLRGEGRHPTFADAVHGGVIIEYEPPRSFSAGRARARIRHAMQQAQQYVVRMAYDEGRPIADYTLLVWDGAHIAFGRTDGKAANWERLTAFDTVQATRVLDLLRAHGRPLVHPGVLRALIGPESEVGGKLIPALFRAIVQAVSDNEQPQSKTALLFKEWSRLFGQAVGIPTERLDAFVERQSRAHVQPYHADIPCYLFALHTFIALSAKIVAALALPGPSEDVTDAVVQIRDRIRALESGSLFTDAGVTNMIAGDFFSWPVDDSSWDDIEPPLQDLLARIGQLSFDMTRKNVGSVRDLFKGIYEEFVPRELRHALGEVYTPDWLAGHALDQMGWQPGDDLLDPTCGTGTFVLEALRRRLVDGSGNGVRRSAEELLRGLYGMDLNPLAVLAAKASIVVVLGDRLDPSRPIRLPIFLADGINTAEPSAGGHFHHSLQTEKGVREFKVPASVIRSNNVHYFFDILRKNLGAGVPLEATIAETRALGCVQGEEEESLVTETVGVLSDLHRQGWDSIWCPIVADRVAAGSIAKVSHIAGNPPWVKWAHLPPAYATFIKARCREMNVFSEDRYVGGIESDISTVITFQAIRKWLAPRGRLAFFVTATVFANESSQGFRRFAFPDGTPMCRVLAVEDFKNVKAFSGVTNHPALLIVEQGRATTFPVRYRIWSPPTRPATFADGRTFRAKARHDDLLAEPVPGTDAGPWLKGAAEQHAMWRTLFAAGTPSPYTARKGVTTDRNGIYFLKVRRSRSGSGDLVSVVNDPSVGRTPGIPVVSMEIEREHLFPLLRGRGVHPFRAELDADYKVLVPQRGMHGDAALLSECPRTLRFLSRFKDELEKRASYRRYQRNRPFWSTWSTGSYTFRPYKVLWKEMSGHRFAAAYVGPVDDPVLGHKVVVPDHKLYMVPLDTLEEAQFLTGILNAPTVASAIGAYATQLSLGTSVVEYLRIPVLDLGDRDHRRIVKLVGGITDDGGNPSAEVLQELDQVSLSSMQAKGV